MDYQYRIVTYNKNVEVVGNEVIAGMFSNGTMLAQSFATIDHTWTIHIISGQGIRLKQHSGVNLLESPFNLKVSEEKILGEYVLDHNKGRIVTVLYQVF